MTARFIQDPAQGRDVANALRGWMMVALTLIFLSLYGAALLGWIKPLSDERMISRLEPTILVIVGYYFGRLPSQQNEKTLKDEIGRQTQKADAAQHAKEQAQQARESLEEKMKNARTALSSSAPESGLKPLPGKFEKQGWPVKEEALRQSVAAAINILRS
jgi:hypothetical protein